MHHLENYTQMKKLLLIVAAVLLLGLAYYGEKPLLTQNSLPEMEAFYNESLHLDQMSADSVENYIIKVKSFTFTKPYAKYDPLYSDIKENIKKKTNKYYFIY